MPLAMPHVRMAPRQAGRTFEGTLTQPFHYHLFITGVIHRTHACVLGGGIGDHLRRTPRKSDDRCSEAARSCQVVIRYQLIQ